MDKKLVLIDGYGFLFRAFFAIKANMTRSDGTPTNGVYGFTRMLINLLVEVNATHIAVVFDSGKKTFRNDIYDKYKANRPPVPQELIPQFPLIRDVAKALNLCVLEKEGFEADDIIATIALKAVKEGYEVLIVSSDKDLAQVVDENIFIYDAMKQVKVGVEEVKEKWGVENPKQLLDVLSLMGDSADNVPGVPSIGPKTASELINQFGSIENLIENLDKIKQEKRRNAIKDNLDDLLLSKRLITLFTDVSIINSMDELQIKPLNPIKLRDFLNDMEFFSIAKQIEKSFHLDELDNEINEETTSNKFEYKKITDIESLQLILNDLNENLYIDFITENNADYTDIKAISFIDEKRRFIFYIPLIENNVYDFFIVNDDKTLNIEKVLNELKPYLESKVVISYNIKKIIRIAKEYNIDIDKYEDCGVISYLLDNGKFSQELSFLIKNYLYDNVEIKIKNIEENNNLIIDYEKGKLLSKITKDIFSFACFKIEMIYFLHNILFDRIQGDNLLEFYNNLEKPLIKVLADMEFEGIKINIKELANLSIYFQGEIDRLEKDIYELSGEHFNIASPKQLGEILFEKMQLPYPKSSAKKTGNYSTDIDILENLSEKGYEIADKILEWRHFSKLKSTYSDILPKLIDKNHRLHTTYLNTYVISGRLSSINPNLQNIPIKTEEGVKIRKAFVAKDGYKFVGGDYSQVELRVLAEFANVKGLIKLFNDGIDIHMETAKQIFPDQEITRELRGYAKAINFSIIYGTTAFGLSKRLNTTKNSAQKYMDNYFKIYPEVKIYMNKEIEFAKENGYVETLFGRKAYIDNDIKGIQKAYVDRLCINAPIQGTAADIIKKAMIVLYDKLKGYDAKILLQIHDELIVEVKEEQAEEVAKIMQNTMENIVKFKIPLLAECKIGNNWDEIH